MSDKNINEPVIQLIMPSSVGEGIYAFAQERARQAEKGYTPDHDDELENHELIAAGLAYIELANCQLTNAETDSPPFNWPWESEYWKPSENPMRNLEKGGALLAAGYDKLYKESNASSEG